MNYSGHTFIINPSQEELINPLLQLYRKISEAREL